MKRGTMCIALAISCIAAFCQGTLAQSDSLGGSHWKGDESCGSIYFSDDGTGVVVESFGSTTIQWSLKGDSVHVDFDNWYGGIDGVIREGKRLDAIETWKPDTSQQVMHDNCVFRRM